METWKYLLVLCVLVVVAVCHTEARRRGGGNRRRGGGGGGGGGGRRGAPPADAQNVTRWELALAGGGAAQEAGYGWQGQVHVLSKDRPALRDARFKPARTVYDFSGGSPVALLKVKKNCFLMEVPQDLTFDALLSQITSGPSRRVAGSPVERYAVGLSEEQTRSLQGRPSLTADLCRNSRRPVMALSDTMPPGFSEKKSVMVSTLDSVLNIKMPERSGSRPRPGRRGRNRKGGRRGNRRGRKGGQ